MSTLYHYFSIVLPLGFEPRSRANLALTGYKSAALPLSYGSEKDPPATSRSQIQYGFRTPYQILTLMIHHIVTFTGKKGGT